jgi:formate-nitrite transporter family protein
MADDLQSSDERGDVEALKAANAKDLHRTVREEGEAELARPARSLAWSGLAAGLAITASLVAEGALALHVPAGAPGRELVVALGYPVGFLLVVLGRMQFFTESTVTAMLPLVHHGTLGMAARTLTLWSVVLAANLAGTALATGALATGALGQPGLAASMVELAREVTARGPAATFVNAIPAGFLIAVLAWLLPNARPGVLPILLVTYAIAVAGFSHSIVGSAEAFLLAWSGVAGWGTALLLVVLPAAAGNLVGGAGIFALLAHAQVRDEGEKA